MDGAFDLALAEFRVDRAPNVMDGHDLLDGSVVGIGDYELSRVAKRRMDDWILDLLLERVRPIDAVLALDEGGEGASSAA